MRKIVIFLKLILRSKFIFKTPEKCDLIVFDEVSVLDLKTCLSKFNYFILQARLESPIEKSYWGTIEKHRIYFSYKILRKIIKNYNKGNWFTVYLASLIELIEPKVVITTINIPFKFSDVAKILDNKINFIAIQNAMEHDFREFDYLYKTKKIKKNLNEKIYIPNLYCWGDFEKEIFPKYIKVNNFYPIGSLRLANFFNHIKSETSSPSKYNCDICLITQFFPNPSEEIVKKNVIRTYFSEHEEGFIKLIKYTIKFCIKYNMKLTIPLKGGDRKNFPAYYKREIGFLERRFEKEDLNYIKKNILEKEYDNFSTYRAVMNSNVTVGLQTTLLRNKLAMGGKILSCNLTKKDSYNFPVEGICTINNCSFENFEKRLYEICHISPGKFISKLNKKPDYLEKFNKEQSAIDLIREKLSQLGVN